MSAVRDFNGQFAAPDFEWSEELENEWRNPRPKVWYSADTLPAHTNENDDDFADPDFARTFWQTQLLDRHNDEYDDLDEEFDPYPDDAYIDYYGDRYEVMENNIDWWKTPQDEDWSETGIAVATNGTCFEHEDYPNSYANIIGAVAQVDESTFVNEGYTPEDYTTFSPRFHGCPLMKALLSYAEQEWRDWARREYAAEKRGTGKQRAPKWQQRHRSRWRAYWGLRQMYIALSDWHLGADMRPSASGRLDMA